MDHLFESKRGKKCAHKRNMKARRCNHFFPAQLWGTASNSNIDIQSKVLRIITGAPWDVPNAIIYRDIRVSTVKHATRTYSITYHRRLENHPNRLAPSLVRGLSYTRRLKWKHPQDLQTSF